jgi:hypothetical protein
MAAAPALQTANEILNPPTDEETLSLFNPVPGEQAHEINEHILSHPLTLQLNTDDRFFASRPHLKIPPSLRTHNFTGGTLSGEDKIPVPPLIFATRDGSELVSIQCKLSKRTSVNCQYLRYTLCSIFCILGGKAENSGDTSISSFQRFLL